MNWFKRLCLFLFGLSGLLSLAALSLVWVGPWTTQARSLIQENQWYFISLEVLVCVSAVGLALCVLVSLFSPRNPKETVVAQVSDGTITVTRTAVVTQTRHIVEADGTCAVSSVRVKMGKRGNVRVHVRVTPHLPVDVVQRGAILHDELTQGLAKICGDGVKSISIVFTQPEQQGTLSTYVDDAPEDAKAPTQPTGSTPAHDITIPMTSPVDEVPSEIPSEGLVPPEAPVSFEERMSAQEPSLFAEADARSDEAAQDSFSSDALATEGV